MCSKTFSNERLIYSLELEDIRSWAATDFACRAFIEACRILRHEGISCIALKGVVFRASLYEDPGVREMVDADLLVRREEYSRVVSALVENGFVVISGDTEHPVLTRACDQTGLVWGKTYPLGLVEIHRAFGHPYRLTIDYEALWQRATTLDNLCVLSGICNKFSDPWPENALVLSPEDALCHQFVHQTMHLLQVEAKWPEDVARILKKWKPELDIVAQRARCWGLGNSSFFALEFVEESEAARSLKQDLSPGSVKKTWIRSLLKIRSYLTTKHFSLASPWKNNLLKFLIGFALIDRCEDQFTFFRHYLALYIRDQLLLHFGLYFPDD